MDKGFIGLLILSAILFISSLLRVIGLLASEINWYIISICLVYQTLYTIYALYEGKHRTSYRNKRRKNLRAPGDSRRY